MNYYEFSKKIESLKSDLKSGHFIILINNLSKYFRVINEEIKNTLSGSNEQALAIIAKTKSILSTAIQFEKENIDPFDAYEQGKRIQNNLNDISKLLKCDESNPLDTASFEIETLMGLHKDHIRGYNHRTLFALSEQAFIVDQTLRGIVDTYLSLKPALLGREADNQLVIVFGKIQNPKDLANKILSVDNIYNEICQYANISISENPLQIIKSESGSPWYVKISGHPLVIAIITALITAGIDYVHHKYTDESKFTEIPKVAKAACEVLKLTEQLQEHGLNVTEQLDELNKLSVNLAKNLNNMVANQPDIEINGEPHSIPKSKIQPFIDETKKIEHLKEDHEK
jgi:hypothetical protein